LLRAWKVINRHRRYRLLIAGDGPLAGELRQLAAATGLQNVEFLGHVSDVAAVHRLASIFVLPSPSEGCSNALLEAMASGLCPVVSRVPGNTDVVHDQVNGLLFDDDDEQQLSDAVTRALVDEPLRLRLAIAARQHVVAHHDLDKIAAELIELFGQLSTSETQELQPKRLQDMSVAVVGYGSIGRRHCDNLAKLGVGRRAVVRRPGTFNPAFTPTDEVRVIRSLQESIQAGIDLALICNSTALHLATAQEYIDAGIPALIEKPLAANLHEAEQFVERAERSGVPVGMAYCLRYHPAYILAREYVRQGNLGTIERVRAWFDSFLPDWHPWEDYRQSYAARAELGGGVLPTLDHEIDFVLWCFGPPHRCSAKSWRSGTLDIDVDDSAKLVLNYPSHVAQIDLSFGQTERRRGFEFVGNEATLSFSFEQQRLQLVDREKASEQTLWHEPGYDVNEMYLAMLRDALDAIVGGRPMPAPLSAGLDALRIAPVERNSFRSSQPR
jgi:predicted dehydrogenase